MVLVKFEVERYFVDHPTNQILGTPVSRASSRARNETHCLEMAAFQKRRPLHASSWYTEHAGKLARQLDGWLENAAKTKESVLGEIGDQRVVGVIAPHAGYSYSGPTAGFAYKFVDPEKVRRVFILGPSHHYYLETCALSAAREYETPLGSMELDIEMIAELQARAAPGFFQKMSRKVDEEEHSIEMHLPYIYHTMKGHPFKIVPILVGNLGTDAEQQVGELLAPYLGDEANLFVVSSDFCHWGARFGYQYYNHEEGPIFKSIEALDHRGMDLIERQDISGYYDYLKKTKNTICGRHPIGTILQAMASSSNTFGLKFVKYAQSSHCSHMTDSSVSYASAVFFTPKEQIM